MFRWILILLPLVLATAIGHAATPALPANCASGTLVALSSPNNLSVCGTQEAVGSASTMVYRGIPYAQAPRWQAPQPLPAPSAATVLAATQFGPACPQAGQIALQQSENCLFLNIWVPSTATASSNLPVMVFIHGGAFVSGAGSLAFYDGASLAATNNVIVVTLNYRLGALGFIYAPSLTIDGSSVTFGGNFGLQDQQAAFSWVKANIDAFGGNPGNVTIFGESAGAMSVGLHLLSVPSSNGTVGSTTNSLFQKAIMESNPMGLPYSTSANAANFFNALCTVLGKGQSCWTGAASLDAFLNTASLDQVMAAQQQYVTSGGQLARMAVGGMSQYLPFAPVVDGTFITGQPMSGYASTMQPLPVLMGMNKNEGAAFAGLAFVGEPTLMTPGAYGGLLTSAYGLNAGKVATFSGGAYNASVQSAAAPAYYNINCSQQADGTTACNTQAAASPCTANTNPVTCYGHSTSLNGVPTNCTSQPENEGSKTQTYTCTFAPATATSGCLPPFNATTTTCTQSSTPVCIPSFTGGSATCTFSAGNCTPTTQTCAAPGNGAPVAFANVATDGVFTCGNLKGANSILTAAKQPAIYVYQFTQAPLFDLFSGLPSCSVASGNVCHGAELPYVFNTLANIVYSVPAANATFATAVGTAWANFATYGNPNGSGTANTPWPAYVSGTANVNVLNASGNTVTTSLAGSANCTALWDGIPPLSNH